MHLAKHVRIKWLEKNPICVECLHEGIYKKATCVIMDKCRGPQSLCDKHFEDWRRTNG